MTALINELIDLYEPITRICCKSYRLSEDTVEDVMHDTFLAAYQNMSKCREHSKVRFWLKTIAKHQAVNHIRKQSKSKQWKPVDTMHESCLSSQNPAELVQSHELHRKLHSGIAALPSTWRTIVIFFYWHQKNTYEIAMRLQIKPGTIWTILHRSRQLLRKELEGIYAA